MRGRKGNWRTEEIHGTGNGKGIFFIRGGTVSFWGTRTWMQNGTQMLQQPFRMQSSATKSSMKKKKKKEATWASLGSFLKRVDRTESSQSLCPQCQEWVKLQLALHLLLLMILQLYQLPPLLPPSVSNSSCLFTPCQSLCARCCTYYSSALSTGGCDRLTKRSVAERNYPTSEVRGRGRNWTEL